MDRTRKLPNITWSTLAVALGVFVLSFIAFWPGVSGGFLFDDYHNIVTNAHVQIKSLAWDSLWRAANAYSDGTRQLAMVTFALNAYWAGLNPWAYKVTGLLVHACNAVLVFFLVRRILDSCRIVAFRQRTMAAGAIALIWAIHPLQVSSALYIVQRMETLCFGFLFVALLLYLRAREEQIKIGHSHKGLWLGMVLAWLGAWFCKESAVLLPLFCLGLEATVLGFASANPVQSRFWRGICWFGGLLAVLVFVLWVWPRYYSSEPYSGRDFNTAQRLLTQCRVLLLYVQQILLPLPSTIHFYYDDFPVSVGWLHPASTVVSALVLVTALVSAILGRRRFPVFSLGLFWFFAAHFLTSNIVPLEMVFEHRNYFASLGLLLVCAELIARLPVRDGPAIKYVGIAALLVGVGILGCIRAATWGNVLLLATDMVDKNPRSARAGMDLGVAYYEMSGGNPDSPFYQFAISQFSRVAEMPHASTQADVNLILMASSPGLPDGVLDVKAIWKRYLQRLQTVHLSVETRTSLWSLLSERMKGKAIDDGGLERALNIILDREDQPDYRLAQVADYYLRVRGKRERAVVLYEEAVRKARQGNNQRLIDSIVGELLTSGEQELVGHLILVD